MSRPDDKASKLLESIPGFPPPIPEIQEVKVVMRLRASPPGRSGQQVCSPPQDSEQRSAPHPVFRKDSKDIVVDFTTQSDRPKLEAKKSMDYPMGFKTKESVFGPSNPETDSFVASPATSRKEDPVAPGADGSLDDAFSAGCI
ncbi:unnamed protein product [Knipowitschia caucasica]